MSISMQTPTTIHQSRLTEIAQTEKILADLEGGRKAVSTYIAYLVKMLGEDTEKLWEQGYIQNKDLSEMIVLHPTMVATDKIMFLDFLVQDSDYANSITAYRSILKNQKRKMKEFSKKTVLKEALRDYLGSDNLG